MVKNPVASNPDVENKHMDTKGERGGWDELGDRH